MANYFIALAGNIGAGKTNFSKVLSRRLGWELELEPVDDNPYLQDFYQDMKTWSFHSQVFYFGRTLKTHFNLIQRNYSVVQDRSFYENAEIFTKNLYQQKLLSERDWQTYQDLYQAAQTVTTPPDLLIYLKAAPETLAGRILKRGRKAEKGISLDYIAQLNTLYDNWITDFQLCPTLTVSIEGTDLRERAEEQDQIIAKIWEILGQDPQAVGNDLLQLHFSPAGTAKDSR